MLSASVFISAVLAGFALAAPVLEPTRSFQKRTPPAIASGFTPQQTTQIIDAFDNALELASYTQQLPRSFTDPIFAKYFDPADRGTVDGNGDPANPGSGNSLLGQITIVPDFPDTRGDLSCTDGYTMAALEGVSTADPRMIICDPAGFGHGGISKSYGSVPPVDCTTIQIPRVSWQMETLGSILLHEYTHFTMLVSPPLATNTIDIAYGPLDSRNLAKNMATQNADSYTWYANEVFWTGICSVQYGDPTLADGEDPNCGGQVCKAPIVPP